MTDLYFIPGLGADYRLFTKQKLAGFSFTVLEWIKPLQGETITSYALRLSEVIRDKKNFALVGVSLGGIMAQEIARIYHPRKLIIISTAKSERDIPFYFKMLRYIPLHKLCSGDLLKSAGMVARRILGGTNKDESLQVQEMIAAADPDFIYWAINEVIHWKFGPELPDVIHFHGTRDLMFPGILIKKANFIRGGSHIMVYTKAEQINLKLHKILD